MTTKAGSSMGCFPGKSRSLIAGSLITGLSTPLLRRGRPDSTFVDISYDGAGRRTAVVDALERRTRYVYDAYGRLEAVIDPAGQTTRYGYDLMSNLTSLTDAAGRETQFEYDGAGRP